MSSGILSPLRRVPRWLTVGFLAAALVGFADAAYLTVQHYRGANVYCGEGLGNCNAVLGSEYAVMLGVPVSLAGAIYYAALFFLMLAYFDSGRVMFLRLAFGLTAGGFLASLWFIFLQASVIGAYCAYCLLSAGLSTALFAGALWGTYVLSRSQH